MSGALLVVAIVLTAVNGLGAVEVLPLAPWQFRALGLVGMLAWLGWIGMGLSRP